ncbi:hypothetical protein GCM10023195_56330 [Actinoallomurus liliacearum]|uniref:Major facilitator superfamily (MFS) profile domain-containing protein n=1 Tax=Actinoallomurus liliacearum TaxID=1080073 RepID=A0ABP8TP76_9ACTN
MLGTLFTALSAPAVLGMREAFVLFLAGQVVIALVITVFGRKLPDLR